MDCTRASLPKSNNANSDLHKNEGGFDLIISRTSRAEQEAASSNAHMPQTNLVSQSRSLSWGHLPPGRQDQVRVWA